MRTVVDIVVVLNVAAGLIGYLWRRRRIQKRNENLDHIRQMEVEGKEIDQILERMGANNVRNLDRAREERNGRTEGRPQERGVRDPERDHRHGPTR